MTDKPPPPAPIDGPRIIITDDAERLPMSLGNFRRRHEHLTRVGRKADAYPAVEVDPLIGELVAYATKLETDLAQLRTRERSSRNALAAAQEVARGRDATIKGLQVKLNSPEAVQAVMAARRQAEGILADARELAARIESDARDAAVAHLAGAGAGAGGDGPEHDDPAEHLVGRTAWLAVELPAAQGRLAVLERERDHLAELTGRLEEAIPGARVNLQAAGAVTEATSL